MTHTEIALPWAAQQLDQTDYAPGLVAFLVIFVIAITCWLLFRSMTKHIRRANANAARLEDTADGPSSPAAPGPASTQD